MDGDNPLTSGSTLIPTPIISANPRSRSPTYGYHETKAPIHPQGLIFWMNSPLRVILQGKIAVNLAAFPSPNPYVFSNESAH